jgi:hypothetical protein
VRDRDPSLPDRLDGNVICILRLSPGDDKGVAAINYYPEREGDLSNSVDEQFNVPYVPARADRIFGGADLLKKRIRSPKKELLGEALRDLPNDSR